MNYIEKVQPPSGALISALMKGEAGPELQATWMLLFDEYNEMARTAKKVGVFPLKMSCRVCYMKVYLWYLKTHKDGRN
jgi:hypothetical protein